MGLFACGPGRKVTQQKDARDRDNGSAEFCFSAVLCDDPQPGRDCIFLKQRSAARYDSTINVIISCEGSVCCCCADVRMRDSWTLSFGETLCDLEHQVFLTAFQKKADFPFFVLETGKFRGTLLFCHLSLLFCQRTRLTTRSPSVFRCHYE